VLAALRDGERDVETLAATAGFAPGVLLPALAELEIAGRIERRSGGYALVPNDA
jgi:predicted Rossmann fold nucleotide-binding protein DprA/Smf involved in DNA uptake